MKLTPELLARFKAKLDKHSSKCGCWLWTASVIKGGYGQFCIGNKQMIVAHRFSWIIYRGSIPRDLYVLHNCPGGDNPACVNPKHLWLGSYQANTQDCIQKKRHACLRLGQRRNNSKLTSKDVKQIRTNYASGEFTQRLLAKKYNVVEYTIWAILHRVTWKHIK